MANIQKEAVELHNSYSSSSSSRGINVGATIGYGIKYRQQETVEVFQPAETTGIQMKQSMQMETSEM